MSDTKLELTQEAIVTIGRMQQRVYEIGVAYGESSDEFLKALRSLVISLASVFRLGGRITQDGELGLYGVSFITYGVVAHARYRDGERDPMVVEWSVHS